MRHMCSSAWTVLAMAASITSAAAQAGAPATAQPTPDLGRSVTLKGCLKSWDGTPTGIGREATGRPPMFVLTKVEAAPAATPPTPTGTSGTSSPPTAKDRLAHDTFVLEPIDPALQLRSHVDQQVEVIGTLEVMPPHDASGAGLWPAQPDPAGTGTTTGSPFPALPPARTETPAPTRVPMERVRVTSVKPLASNCR